MKRQWLIGGLALILILVGLGIARAVKQPYISMPVGTYWGPREEAIDADPAKGYGKSLLGLGLFIGEVQELTIYRDKDRVSLPRSGQSGDAIAWRKEVGPTEAYEARALEWRNGLWCVEATHIKEGKCVWAARHFVVFDKLYNHPDYKPPKSP